MKYYKRIIGNIRGIYEINKIYPGDFRPALGYINVSTSVLYYANKWQEVSEEEYLKQEGKINNKTYVKVVNTGKSYPTHPHAKEYGLVNYHYWEGLPNVNKGNIYELVKEVIVNGYDPSYIIKDKEGIEYLIGKSGCEIVEDKKQMEKKIIGYKLIKPEYEKAAHALMNNTGFYKDGKVDIRLKDTINIFKKVGVLDLWFEPVYEEQFKVDDWVVFEAERVKEEYPHLYTGTWNKDHILKIDEIDGDNLRFRNQLGHSNISNSFKCFRKATPEEIKKAQVPDITIKGFKAEFKENSVVFGCQTYNKDFVLQLGEFLSKSGLELEHQEEVIKVVEYYKNK